MLIHFHEDHDHHHEDGRTTAYLTGMQLDIPDDHGERAIAAGAATQPTVRLSKPSKPAEAPQPFSDVQDAPEASPEA